MDGGDATGALPEVVVGEELGLELEGVEVPALGVLPVPVALGVPVLGVPVPAPGDDDEVVLVVLVPVPWANGLWALPVRRELPGVDCTLIVGSDEPVAGAGVGSGAWATGVGLEDFESSTGIAMMAASSTRATGQSFF